MRQNEEHASSGFKATPGSIVVLGDDPLMVRALNRLLRTAGYCVGSGERLAGTANARVAPSPCSNVALTIVDLPDDRTRPDPTLNDFSASRPLAGRVLWISGAMAVDAETDGCLVKPFTSNQLLDKVRALLSRQPSH